MTAVVDTDRSKVRLRRIDVLRGFAILFVFLLHWFGHAFGTDHLAWHGLIRDFHSAPEPAFYLFFPLSFGWMGVPLFFVISGFCIHISELRRAKFSAARFFRLRFWRIYPPYVIAVLFFAWLTGTFRSADASAQLWSHLLLVHNFKQQWFAGINPVFWSLAVEAQLYLLYPLLLFLRSRVGLRGALFSTLLLSLVSRAVGIFVTDWTGDLPGNVWTFPTMLWFDWTLGAFVAERFSAGRRAFPDSRLLRYLAFAVVVLSTFYKPAMIFTFSLASLAFAFALDAYLHRERNTLSLAERVLLPVGICSYSLYLIHYPLVAPMWRFVRQWLALSVPSSMLIALPFAFAVAVAIAYVCYIVIERPSARVGHILAARVQRKRGTP